jgi:uncharacterized protein YukE
MAWLGMNVPKCEQLSADLGSEHAKLVSLAGQIDSEVSKIDRSWNGDDSVAFVNKWRSAQHQQVVDAARFIKDLKTTLDHEIAQQKRTSK